MIMYNEKSDIFALGWIMAEFYTLKPIFCGSSSSDQLSKYLDVLGIEQMSGWEEGLELLK